MKLECTSCNYQFVPKTGKVPLKCPYCSKEGSVEKVKDMQEYVDDV